MYSNDQILRLIQIGKDLDRVIAGIKVTPPTAFVCIVETIATLKMFTAGVKMEVDHVETHSTNFNAALDAVETKLMKATLLMEELCKNSSIIVHTFTRNMKGDRHVN